MRLYIGSLLVGTLALSACQMKPPTGSDKKPTLTSTKQQAATPIKAPSLAPSKAPVAGVPLAGTVQVDAAYMVNSGSGVIAAGGGNVIAAGGGNVIAAGGGNYRVAAAPAIGTVLPVAGMSVQAIALATGEAIGEPVLTDAKGAFKLNVPEGLQDNVLLIASVPGSTDARLRYTLVTSGKQATGLAIDEDTALVTRYMRSCVVKRFAAMVNEGNVTGSVDEWVGKLGVPEAARFLVTNAFTELQNKARETGADKMPLEEREAGAQLFADALLSKVKLNELTIDPTFFKGKPGVGEDAVAVFGEILRLGRASALVKMEANPAYFEQQDYIRQAKHWKTGIKKPSDLGDFLVQEYMGEVEGNVYEKMARVYNAVGVPEEQTDRIYPAATTMTIAIMKVLVLDEASRRESLKAFDRIAKR